MRNRIILLLSVFFQMAGGISFFTYYPRFLSALGADNFLISFIISMFSLASFIFPSIIGFFSDKFQTRKKFIRYGIIGNIIIIIPIFFIGIEYIWIYFPLIFISGFFINCYGMIYPLFSEVCLNDSKWISYYSAVVASAWFFGSFFCGIYVDLIGIEYLFYYYISFLLISFIFSLFIKENREEIFKLNKSLKQDNLVNVDLEKIQHDNILNTISYSLYFALFFRNFGIRPIFNVLAIFFALTLTSDIEIGFLISINFLLQIAISVMIGRIINKKNMKFILILGFIFSSFAMLGYYFSRDFWGFLIAQLLVSFSYAAFWTASMIYISQNTTPENKGRYVGLANSFFSLGNFTGNIFFGILLMINDNFYFTILVLFLFPTISALFILFGFKSTKTMEIKNNLHSKREIIAV